MGMESDRSEYLPADEFTGFLANPSAQQRGGTKVRAARSQKRPGLLERMAQAEVNRFLRVEIAAKYYFSPTAPADSNLSVTGIERGTVEHTSAS